MVGIERAAQRRFFISQSDWNPFKIALSITVIMCDTVSHTTVSTKVTAAWLPQHIAVTHSREIRGRLLIRIEEVAFQLGAGDSCEQCAKGSDDLHVGIYFLK